MVIDTVLPPAKTEHEEWQRWLNRMHCELIALPYYKKRKIEVRYG